MSRPTPHPSRDRTDARLVIVIVIVSDGRFANLFGGAVWTLCLVSLVSFPVWRGWFRIGGCGFVLALNTGQPLHEEGGESSLGQLCTLCMQDTCAITSVESAARSYRSRALHRRNQHLRSRSERLLPLYSLLFPTIRISLPSFQAGAHHHVTPPPYPH
ncbi:hypothetical protein K505DRAFT_326400 [Melanomma pulvis-pyrius CBS 109.77]|uniref:Uncharacterized protein n=1 Tax=Melanomma pulvis-pyrius CBS 109.77 TaxID=1314802 RepID=A0A6A6X6F8_9PLEO|nr:hypothetical protein K505DRAFT_326400 [Melanomma pulvis-pyrius CBS 109.77]